jgi:hypothetical protein
MFKKILTGIALAAIMIPVNSANDGSKSISNKIITKKKAKNSNETNKKTLLLIKIEITGDKGKKNCSPRVIVHNGQEAKVKFISKVYFPVSWKVPVFAKTDSKNAKSVPSVPMFDKPTDIGISISITPQIVKHPKKGEIIFAYGKITIAKNSKFKKIIYPGFEYKGMQHSIKSNTTSFMLYFVDKNEQNISFKYGGSLYKVKVYCNKYKSKLKINNKKGRK